MSMFTRTYSQTFYISVQSLHVTSTSIAVNAFKERYKVAATHIFRVPPGVFYFRLPCGNIVDFLVNVVDQRVEFGGGCLLVNEILRHR